MSRPMRPKLKRKPVPVPAPPVVATEPGIVEVLEAAHEALRDVKRERRWSEQILDASTETG